MKTLIVDIDGTLADCRHRLHHVLPGKKRDWEAFFAGIGNDPVIGPVRDAVFVLSDRYDTVLCSGRPERLREKTEDWLYRVAGLDQFISWDKLYMRPDNDTRPDHVVKKELLGRIRDDGYEPFLVIDDRQTVVDMWRAEGLVCLQAAPDQAPIPDTARLTLMVGPSGAGKTTMLERMADCNSIHVTSVVSADVIREQLCGDFRSQERNQEVWQAVHSIATARLRAGLPVYLDGTHLRRKDRLSSALLVPATVPVTYMVVDRPEKDKLKDGGWRLEAAGGKLITRHAEIFKANLKDILAGDNLPNVTVLDLRTT